ncbi:unnamed protein product [Effrenium voratum]|nr:unnamed protein product [Effrenium voratum]
MRRWAWLLPWAAFAEDVGCERRFYVLSLEEAEVRAPQLRRCSVLAYAEALRRGLASSKCAGSLEEAEVVVVPGYTFRNCHWPSYGQGCSDANVFRAGEECYDPSAVQSYGLLRDHPDFGGKALALVDAGASVLKAWLADVYSDPRFILLRLGPALWFHRAGVDVSLPPGPTPRCSGAAAQHAMDEPLSARRYLASFKGKLRNNAARVAMAKLHHNDLDVIVVDRLDDSHGYEELLYSSVFPLILEGDMLQTFRFTEAVCSGGIPVLVTSSQVPPLQELVPFESYGVLFREEELPSLVARLRALDGLTRARLRERALQVCRAHFRTLELQAASVALQLSRRPRSQGEKEACGHGFHALSLTETEAMCPELRACQVPRAALDFHESFRKLKNGACMARLEESHVVLLPGYSGGARNLPARRGRRCSDEEILGAYNRLLSHARLDGKLLLLASGFGGFAEVGTEGVEPFAWLRVHPSQENFRNGHDLSVPPAPTELCSSVQASQSFLEPLAGKRFLVSFKGRLNGPLLDGPLSALHDGLEAVVVDEADARYSSEYLLFNSAFSLVVPGEGSRFNEAVCSGGVPAAVANSSWVPPLEGFFLFESYGLRLTEAEAFGVVPFLRSVLADVAQVQLLRENARRVCSSALQTREIQAAAVLAAFHQPNRGYEERVGQLLLQTIYDEDSNVFYALFQDQILYKAVAGRANTFQSVWISVGAGPFDYVASSQEAVFAIGPGQKVYKFAGPLSRVDPDSAWVESSRGEVTSIALAGEVVLAAGMDGHIYRQLLREMSPESDWQLLVEGYHFDRIALQQGVIFASGSGGRIYSLDLARLPGAHWSLTARRHLPGDLRHLF